MQEACLLARSSLPQQRVLALRLLGAVLALSRPSMAGASAVALVPLPPVVTAALLQEGEPAAAVAAAGGLEWSAVWHNALHVADANLLLRRSLDDANTAVAAAAAEALAALVGAAGPGAVAEEAATEAVDACPLTGWPAPPLRHMQVIGGAWERGVGAFGGSHTVDGTTRMRPLFCIQLCLLLWQPAARSAPPPAAHGWRHLLLPASTRTATLRMKGQRRRWMSASWLRWTRCQVRRGEVGLVEVGWTCCQMGARLAAGSGVPSLAHSKPRFAQIAASNSVEAVFLSCVWATAALPACPHACSLQVCCI